jgi:F-type H+-transporting ATPase subunit delta
MTAAGVRRYAEAFLQVCADSVGMEEAAEELAYLKNLIGSNGELKAFLASAAVGISEKKIFLQKVFGSLLSAPTSYLLLVLCEKGLIGELSAVAESALALYRHTQRSEGIIKSAVPLEQDSVRNIQEYLEKKLGKKLVWIMETDPGLVGGIHVIVDNMVIDGSIRKRLDELKEKLISLKAV